MEFVKINEEFEIGKYPVTNGEYEDYYRTVNLPYPKLIAETLSRINTKSIEYQLFRLHPVVHVTHHDAIAFCNHYGYSLPTEKQWYLAAAGVEKRVYPWGNTWESGYCNTWESGICTTTPVGSFPRGNTLEDVCDMAGNVWEWTASEHEPGSGTFVLRGGSWFNYGDYAACAYRIHFNPDNHYFNFGFRCCRLLKPDINQLSSTELIRNLRSGTQNADAILKILEERLTK